MTQGFLPLLVLFLDSPRDQCAADMLVTEDDFKCPLNFSLNNIRTASFCRSSLHWPPIAAWCVVIANFFRTTTSTGRTRHAASVRFNLQHVCEEIRERWIFPFLSVALITLGLIPPFALLSLPLQRCGLPQIRRQERQEVILLFDLPLVGWTKARTDTCPFPFPVFAITRSSRNGMDFRRTRTTFSVTSVRLH